MNFSLDGVDAEFPLLTHLDGNPLDIIEGGNDILAQRVRECVFDSDNLFDLQVTITEQTVGTEGGDDIVVNQQVCPSLL